MTASPHVYVLLPVHNRRACTERFIRGLSAQHHANWSLILIDDGSTDGTADLVRTVIPSAVLLRGKGDWWWGGALHQGFAWLRQYAETPDDVVLIINDDTVISPEFLAAGVAALMPHALLLARLHDLKTGAFLESGVLWDWRRFTYRAVKDQDAINCFSTRGLFLRVGDFLEIGGFHPYLLPHYLSDYEFTLRAHRKGFRLQTSPLVRLACDESTTGLRHIPQTSRFDRLRSLLSIKSTFNPIYQTSFVMLACPLRYIPLNIAKIWWRFLRILGASRPMAAP